jgi:hypothetical protein
MSDESPKRSTVRGGMITKMASAPAIVAVKAVCTQGMTSPVVQGSTIATEALLELAVAAQAWQEELTTNTSLVQQLRASNKALGGLGQTARKKLQTYGTSVDELAGGDAAVITAAGLPSRPIKSPPAGLEPVKKVRFRPGKMQAQAILSWPEARGAGSYVVQVSFTPETMEDGPWTTYTAAANQSRTVTAPAPRAQFLARVASVGRDGKQSDWTAPVLVTAA